MTADTLDPPPEPLTEPLPEKRTSALLDDAISGFSGDTVPLGALIDVLAERAFGMVLLALALPCAIPFLYGVPQIMSLPMVFIAAQLAFGRRTLWLPTSLRARTIKKDSLTTMMRRARPWLQWFEQISQPRLAVLIRRPMEQVVGALFVLFSLTIMVPLPLTNTLPGIAIAIASLGFIERDGLLVAVGAVLGAMWTVFLLGIAGGAIAIMSAAFDAIMG